MATTSAEAGSPRVIDRWPTALAMVLAGAALFVIVGEQYTDLASGIAAMACIYLAAYVVSRPAFAWVAFPAVVVVMTIVEIAGIDSVLAMTVLLVALWVSAVARGRAGDGRVFVVQTAGMVLFAALTLLSLPFDERGVGVVAGVGFFIHGLWDAYHFVRNEVVNRPWSEACVVVDLILGPALVAVALTS